MPSVLHHDAGGVAQPVLGRAVGDGLTRSESVIHEPHAALRPKLLATWTERHGEWTPRGGRIRTLPFIAPMAGEREVAGIVRIAVYPGDDVLDTEAVERIVVLVNPAVLASAARPPADELAGQGLHQTGLRSLSSLRDFAWRIAR